MGGEKRCSFPMKVWILAPLDLPTSPTGGGEVPCCWVGSVLLQLVPLHSTGISRLRVASCVLRRRLWRRTVKHQPGWFPVRRRTATEEQYANEPGRLIITKCSEQRGRQIFSGQQIPSSEITFLSRLDQIMYSIVQFGNIQMGFT